MPIAPAERIVAIDVIRGFALLGILVVNLPLFAHPMQRLMFPLDPTTPLADRLADWLVRFFAEGKFYSLFSFLFGLGFGIQLLRSQERGSPLAPVYVRRLLILLAIGLIHLFLIWAGDILTFYALAGFVLLPFRTVKPRTLLIWAAILIAIPLALNALGTAAVVGGRMVSPQVAAVIDKSLAVQDSVFRASEAQAAEVYATGSFLEATAQRARDASWMVYGYVAIGPQILGMFLIGLYAARRGVLASIDAHAQLLRKVLLWGIFLGVAGSALYATIIQDAPRIEPGVRQLVAMFGYAFGTPALSLAYAAGLALLLRKSSRHSTLRPLAAAGRMPLSNYLAQSLVCTLAFYGYGLGFFGQTGRLAELAIALALYAALAALSLWYASRFRYGPMEWLWRKGTYGGAFRP
jgi:uncharacterized protein